MLQLPVVQRLYPFLGCLCHEAVRLEYYGSHCPGPQHASVDALMTDKHIVDWLITDKHLAHLLHSATVNWYQWVRSGYTSPWTLVTSNVWIAVSWNRCSQTPAVCLPGTVRAGRWLVTSTVWHANTPLQMHARAGNFPTWLSCKTLTGTCPPVTHFHLQSGIGHLFKHVYSLTCVVFL